MDDANIGINSSDDMLSNILEAMDSDSNQQSSGSGSGSSSFEFHGQYYININDPLKSSTSSECAEMEGKCKRQKVGEWELEPRNIAVERNRRKQMNHHLSVLRSLVPCFYVKRGDQASIIGGVINYINELQQVMQSLEAKKLQRKLGGLGYTSTSTSTSHDRIHTSISSSSVINVNNPSPRKPPLSPRTPTPLIRSPNCNCNCNCNSSSSAASSLNELVATSKSAVAEVEVKFCGPNLVLNTLSHPIPGQLVKILSALQHLPLDILQLNINKLHQTILNSFTIKIGIECQLSAEELAQQIQRTFC